MKSNDGASTPAGDAADGGIIDLVDAGGRPIPGASLVFLDVPQDAAAILKTDESGHVSFPRNALGSRRLVVAAASRAPRIVDCVLRLGENRIEVDGGFALAGRVRVNGHEPRSPLRLSFEYAASATAIASIEKELPKEIVARRATLETVTGENGSFEFLQLPEDAHGEIRFDPSDYRPASGGESAMLVAAPARGFVIDLLENPRVHGVVVDSRHAPIRGARIGIECREGESTRFSASCVALENGRFERHLAFPTKSGANYRGTASIVDPSHVRHRTIDFSFDEASIPSDPSDIDLGEIVLADAINAEFVAIDENSRPLANVIGYPRKGEGEPSAPTDESGRGRLAIASNADESDLCWFATPGFEIVAAALAPGGSTRVVLRRAAAIELTFSRSDGRDPGSCLAELETQGEFPFATPRVDLPPAWLNAQPEEFRSAECISTSFEDHRSQFGFEIKTGTSWLRRIRPGVVFDLSLRDATGVERQRIPNLVLAPGEVRKVSVVFPAAGRVLVVRVLDPEGQPLRSVDVVIHRSPSESNLEAMTDAAGTASFIDIVGNTASVRVRASGFPPVLERIDLAHAEGRPVDIRLGASRKVELSIVDANGERIDDAHRVVAGGDDEDFAKLATWSRELGGGRYAFDELPATGRLRFEVTLGGVVYSLVHDSPAPTATLVVPAQGRVRLSWDLDLKTNYLPFYRFVPIGGGEPIVLDVGSFDPREAHGSDVIPEFRPGRYRVEMSVKEDDAPERQLAVSVAEVEVIAGKTSEVVLVAP